MDHPAFSNAHEPLTFRALHPLLQKSEVLTTVWIRRHLLLRIAELARKSKGHTSLSRWRLKQFRAYLDGLEGNDEIEVEGEIMCEVLQLAMGTLLPP
jgi:hypothetical protein